MYVTGRLRVGKTTGKSIMTYFLRGLGARPRLGEVGPGFFAHLPCAAGSRLVSIYAKREAVEWVHTTQP